MDLRGMASSLWPSVVALLVAACGGGAADPTGGAGSAVVPDSSSGELGTTMTDAPGATTMTGAPGETDAATETSAPTGEPWPGQDPCELCGPDEYCHWAGADDVCQEGLFMYQGECRPLPDDCDREELCTLECVHKICPGSYGCWRGDPCGIGTSLQCNRGPCDPGDPNSCATEGTTCKLVASDAQAGWDRFECVPSSGLDAAVGDACTVISDGNWAWSSCEPGAECLPDWDTMQGTCTARCTGSADAPACADPARVCVPWNAEVGLYLCEPKCDPLAGADACGAGEVCVPADDVFVCVPAAGDGPGLLRDPCAYTNSCAPGLLCVNVEYVPGCDPLEYSCCAPYCDLTQPMCPDGLQCLPLFPPGEAPEDHVDLGFCGGLP